MKYGYFIDQKNNTVITPQVLEDELPDIFLHDSFNHHKHPKVAYISLLGIICSADSYYVDILLLNRIIDSDYLYLQSKEFLCYRYTFLTYEQ